jgi:hypothetical protein
MDDGGFWPTSEDCEASRLLQRTRGLIEAVVYHVDKSLIPEWRREDWFEPTQLVDQLGVGYYMLSSDVTVDAKELRALLHTPTKSKTLVTYEALKHRVLDGYREVPLVISVNWPKWGRHVVFGPVPVRRDDCSHLTIVVRGVPYVMCPVTDYIKTWKAEQNDHERDRS